MTWFIGFTRRAHLCLQLSSRMGVVIIVEVVVVKEVCREASKSFLKSIGQKRSPFGVVGLSICSPSSSWPALVTESSTALGVVDIVIVVEVDVQTKVIDGPLEPKWWRKVK